MTDRELLELAAKAAMRHGMSIIQTEAGPQILDRFGEGYETYRLWRPHLDDGEAFRLAVKMGIVCSASLHPKYVHDSDTMQAWASLDDRSSEIYAGEEWSKQSGDPYAATRRAIVRAAAEVGRAIP